MKIIIRKNLGDALAETVGAVRVLRCVRLRGLWHVWTV